MSGAMLEILLWGALIVYLQFGPFSFDYITPTDAIYIEKGLKR